MVKRTRGEGGRSLDPSFPRVKNLPLWTTFEGVLGRGGFGGERNLYPRVWGSGGVELSVVHLSSHRPSSLGTPHRRYGDCGGGGARGASHPRRLWRQRGFTSPSRLILNDRHSRDEGSEGTRREQRCRWSDRCRGLVGGGEGSGPMVIPN